MLPFIKNILIIIVSIILIQHTTQATENAATNSGDYYSSLIGVQSLAKKEQQVVAKLLQYKRKLEETIELIDYYLDDYSKSIRPIIKKHSQLQDKFHEEKYPIFESDEDLQWISKQTSANPLMVYKLLRRFAIELTDIRLDLDNSNHHLELKEYISNFSSTMKVPDMSDLTGAADGLLRLQETYQLKTKKMGNGMLLQNNTGCKLLASDMFFIGVRAINTERPFYATGIEWLYHAYQKVMKGDNSLPEKVVKGQLLVARTLHNEEFLKFKLDSSNVFSNLVNSNFSNIAELFIYPFVREYPLGFITDSLFDLYNFNALCRGDQLLSPEETKDLQCWYSHIYSPVNIISPLKMEMLHGNPPVFQVYDLISEKVINHIKSASLPFLERAKVVSSESGGVNSDIRTSSAAWLGDSNGDDDLLLKVPKIVKRVTGLECESSKAAEELQVSCYGSVGGHYIPHLDALISPDVKFTPEMIEDFRRGDRVATVMFYLSDVELGGGTAFPRLGVAAKPIKGSAVIWYNLKLSGERDLLTLHGGCPVLYGNKWVANKWIRLYEQVHVRKCSRVYSE